MTRRARSCSVGAVIRGFGIIGAGIIAAVHADAIALLPDARLLAVTDVAAGAAQAFAAARGCAAEPSLDDLLARHDVDVVCVCVPSGQHAQVGIRAAKAGKHLVIEKPVDVTLEAADRLLAAAREAGVALTVVSQHRFDPGVIALKRLIDDGALGTLVLGEASTKWYRTQEYYDSAPWRGTWEFDGGALMNQASHYVDLVDWLIGPVESVQAYTATLARNIQVEDSGVVAVRWRSGALGSINVTMLTHSKNFEGSITILGEKGTVRIGGVAVNEIQKWDFAESHEDDAKIQSANYETTSVYGFGHPLYYDNVIGALRGELEPETDGREGLRSLELLIAAYLSARDGRRVALPLEY